MKDEFNNQLMPLKHALYGREGLFPFIRMRDAKHVFSRIYRRKPRAGGVTVKWVRIDEYEKLSARLR